MCQLQTNEVDKPCSRAPYTLWVQDELCRILMASKLEQYFDLIVFAAYVDEEEAGDTGRTFSTWLKASTVHMKPVMTESSPSLFQSRPEIWK